MRLRFWMEIVLGTLGALLALASFVWPQWIEMLFDAEPDMGSGEAEWFVTAIFLAVAVVCFVLARIEWRRAQAEISSR